MNRLDLARHIAADHRLSKAGARRIVDDIFRTIMIATRDGGFTLNGFGSFRVAERAARAARNPRTGEKVAVPALRVPHSTAGRAVRAIIDARAGVRRERKQKTQAASSIPQRAHLDSALARAPATDAACRLRSHAVIPS